MFPSPEVTEDSVDDVFVDSLSTRTAGFSIMRRFACTERMNTEYL